jgi:hypothetical protein
MIYVSPLLLSIVNRLNVFLFFHEHSSELKPESEVRGHTDYCISFAVLFFPRIVVNICGFLVLHKL